MSVVIEPPEEIAFRPVPLLPRSLLLIVGCFMAGAAASLWQMPAARFRDPHFLLIMGTWLSIMLGLLTTLCIWRQHRINRRLIRFADDGVELPGNLTRRIFVIPYHHIRNVQAAGTGRRAHLIVDSDDHTFVYPVSSFAEDEVLQRFMTALRPRVDVVHWRAMTERHELVFPWSQRKPWLTWGVALLVLGVFGLQLVVNGVVGSVDPLAILDLGANAGFLVGAGEWYRLVSANLLHAGFAHFAMNTLFLVIYGAIVEKQLGRGRTLAVMLGAGLVAQAASAAWMSVNPFHTHVIEAVGFSGVLFGLLGALGVLNIRFGRQVPGGYRLTPASWSVLLVANLVVAPLISPQIDSAAHVGGLLSGFGLSWLLLLRQTTIGEMPALSAREKMALAGLAVVWVTGLAQTAVIAFDPARRAAEHAAAIHAVRAADRTRPVLDNQFAWAVAVQPQVDAQTLEDALFLAGRAVEREQNAATRRNDLDTLATVHYRLGDFDAAVRIEQPLTYRPAVSGSRSQMARFLDARLRRDGIRWVGEPGDMPILTLVPGKEGQAWRLNVAVPQAMPHGGEIYALVRQGGILRGLIRVYVAPNAGPVQASGAAMVGTELLPGALEAKGPAPELALAEIDRTGTNVDAAPISPYFYPFEKSVAALP